MQKFIVRGLSVLVAGAVFAIPALAKAPTEKLVISGPGIAGLLETTDPRVITPSIWAGDFVDWNSKAAAPGVRHARYTVRFHVSQPRHESRAAYVVYYVWDPETERALVYIAGPGDEWYRVNAGSIVRDGSDGQSWRDGQWYVANDAWGRAIHDLLQGQGALRAAR
jgi:hypothetical protein